MDNLFTYCWRVHGHILRPGGQGEGIHIRRIVGVAHVADMDRIEDEKVRAECERKALKFGKRLLVGRYEFANIEQVTEEAQNFLL